MNGLNKKTILLVEDESLIALSVKKVLEGFGYNVLTASSGKKAISTFNDNKTDLVLMDIDLGKGIDGTEAAKIILKENDIPVVFLSSHTESEVVEKTEKITSYGYVVKNSANTVLDASIKMAFKLFETKKIVQNELTERKRAEEALNESKVFLDNMSDIAYTTDTQGNLIWINQSIKRITGFLPEEVIGKSFLPLFIEADHVSIKDVYRRTLSGESLENTLTFTSGVICQITSLPKRNEMREIVGTFGVARDITERLIAEKALRLNDIRMNKGERMAKTGNWEYDLSTGQVWGSEEAFRIYGFERTSEFLPLDEVESHIIEAKRVNQSLIGLITRGEDYDIEFDIIQKGSKKLIPIHSIAELEKDNEGNPVKVTGVIRDITERKQTEEALRKSEELLASQFNLANIGLAITSPEKSWIKVNNNLCDVFGYTEDEFKKKTWREMTHPDDLESDLKQFKKVLAGEIDIYDLDKRFIRKDGSIVITHLTVGCVRNPDKTVNYLIVSLEDITDRKKAEAALQKTLLKNKALLSELQHRVRNSFSMISSMISLTAGSSISDDVKSALSVVDSRIKAVSEIYALLYTTDSIIDVRLGEYLIKIASSLSIASGNITLKNKCDNITLPVKTAIPVGLIVTELITNSIKHAFPGNRNGIINLLLKKNKAAAIIEVNDDGIGFPEEYDLSSTDSLGLTLVHVLVDQIGGNYNIESKKGTRCIVEFPIEKNVSS